MSYDPNDAKSIFVQALELPTPAERAAFVANACTGRPALQARVETLLKSADNPDSLLDRPGAAGATEVLMAGSAVSLGFLEPCDVPGSLGRLGTYVVLEVIGRGGMGIVLRANDPKLNRVVAIKVLAPEWSGNPHARKRFLREAKAAAAVRHDHIVTIYAVHDEHLLPFIVMECIVGQSLQQKIDNSGPQDLKEILRIGMQIAEGLAAAHHHGLVHRDVKPANILLENGVQRVKLTDFGLARMVDDASVTQSGTIAGTPQYMSPEQAHGGDIDHRSDLFSLGCVLYAMCVGRAPFRASTTMGVLRRVCEESPRPIREQNPEIPDWLVGIIERLLQKSPDERYQSAAEVAELLRLCLLHVQQPHSTPLPDDLPVSSPAHVAPGAQSSHGILSGGVVIAVLGLLLLGIAGAMVVVPVLFYLLSWQSPPSPQMDVRSQVSATASSDTSLVPPDNSADANTVNMARPPKPAVAPFDAEQAQRLQQSWAEWLGVPIEVTVSGIRLRLIPPGEFQMGSTPDELAHLKQLLAAEGASDFDRFISQTSGPRHAVEISRAFYMGQYEVTLAQFERFTRVPRLDWLPPDGDPEEQPLCGVSWEEAKAFCRWLNENAPPGSEGTFDLPTEAQWEYACRAGTQSLWSFGDDPAALSEYAIVDQKGSRYPAPIGLRRANPFGLWDLHGNVSEWCQDWHIQDFYGRSPLQDPVYNAQPSQSGSGRVVRGGSWNAAPWVSRSATRSYDSPTAPVFPTGFRVVKTIPATKAGK